MFSIDDPFQISVSTQLLLQNVLFFVESFALFSTHDHFEIGVSISLLLPNLPLLVERVSFCSLQIIALKKVRQFRDCYKICPCSQRRFKITRNVHKMLMRRVLSDRYRITQENFQYHGVEMYKIGHVFQRQSKR